MSKNLLKIEGLTAWYDPDKKILKDMDIELNRNEIVGMIGLNGAGKTTFLKVLTGLLKQIRRPLKARISTSGIMLSRLRDM